MIRRLQIARKSIGLTALLLYSLVLIISCEASGQDNAQDLQGAGKKSPATVNEHISYGTKSDLATVQPTLGTGKLTPGPTPTPSIQLRAEPSPQRTPSPPKWPLIVENKWLYVRNLSSQTYESSEDPASFWLRVAAKAGGFEANIAQQPPPDCVIRNGAWPCGYEYAVKVPTSYAQSAKAFPVVLFLHGGGPSSVLGRSNRNSIDRIHVPPDDPFILVAPAKNEWEWNPNKIDAVISDLRQHLRVDDDRIYLTGLSMGGRGSFIVAAALPDVFAALMPLSSHHEPYSYIPLAKEVAHLPIWSSHGDADVISSHRVALGMASALKSEGAYVRFSSIPGGTHSGWGLIYSDPVRMNWLLSQVRGETPSYYLSVRGGTGSGFFQAGQTVRVSAAIEGSQKSFNQWLVVGNGELPDPTVSSVNFTMPKGDVELRAVMQGP